MTKSGWVAEKLKQQVGIAEVSVQTETRINAKYNHNSLVIACASGDPVTGDEIDDILSDAPCAQFIVVIPKTVRIDPSAWLRCSVLNVGLGGIVDLSDGISSGDAPRSFRNKNMRFIISRFESVRTATAITRIGHNTLQFFINSRSFVATFVEDYEMTEEETVAVLAASPASDFLIVTNPYAKGMSQDSVQAAKDSGVRMFLLQEFVSNMKSLCS